MVRGWRLGPAQPFSPTLSLTIHTWAKKKNAVYSTKGYLRLHPKLLDLISACSTRGTQVVVTDVKIIISNSRKHEHEKQVQPQEQLPVGASATKLRPATTTPREMNCQFAIQPWSL
jgi:hypothetical protein